MDTTRPAPSGGGNVDVRLLGTVEVIGPGGPAVLPGSRQRALVGLLALRPGVIVPRSSLVDALWGEEPPRTAVKTLYSHVTRVRQAMEACGLPDVLSTREPGYALLVPRADVDAHRFAEHVRQAGASKTPAEVAGHLRTALELWRGDAFADTPLAGWGAAEVDRLHEARLTASEDLWEAELELGQHRRAAAELEPLVARHPYRERLVALLMLARYRSGRHAEALDAYHRLRTRLDDELGVDPGPDLQRRYAAILRHDPELDPAPPAAAVASLISRPAQLPAPVGHFTGRTQELDELDRVLDHIRIIAVSGPAGMGKTALALHWAHRIKDRFADGQLFLELRGHEPGDTAMTATEALPHLLRSLGVPPDRVPAELTEQAGMYRSLLHDKRLLIVLDNCGSVDQVLPLVPGTDSSLLVLTSRGQLTALAARHAVHLVGLDSLEQTEAVDLLGRVLGTERVEREPSSAADLVELCGRMPLALRIAAALLAARPKQPIGELAAGLAGENRLEALSIEGDSRSLRAVFASAYDAVSAPAARLFRLLGQHPGRTITGHLAAAAAAVSVNEAHDRLAELVAAHLINDLGDGRYRFHDLIRLYAAECAHRDEPPAVRIETVDRIMDWYLAIAGAASRILDRQRDQVVPVLRYPPAELPVFADHDGVLGFLEGERANLVPLVRYATEHGHSTAAWQLTYLLAGFFRFRGHWADRIEICRWAVTAAERDGDPLAESLMHSSLGVAYYAVHRFADALQPLRRSLALAHSIGDKRAQGNAHHNLGGSYAGLRRHDEAIDSFQQALALFTATNQTVPMALMHNNIGEIYARTGQTELGFEHLRRGLDLAHDLGDPWLEAAITHSIGQAHLRDGNIEDAESYLRQALATRRRVGDHRFAAETLTYLGAAHLARGDSTAAIDILREAVATCREVADEHLEATALNHLGEAHLRAGDPTAATEPLQLALALRTRLPDPEEEALIQHHLGEVRRLRDDPTATYRPHAAEQADVAPEVPGQAEQGGGLPPAATPRQTATNRSRRPG